MFSIHTEVERKISIFFSHLQTEKILFYAGIGDGRVRAVCDTTGKKSGEKFIYRQACMIHLYNPVRTGLNESFSLKIYFCTEPKTGPSF